MNTEESSQQKKPQEPEMLPRGRRKWRISPADLGLPIIAVCLVSLGVGIATGYLFTGGKTGSAAEEEAPEDEANTIWTCSMDPQVKLPEPGLCPVCGMDLIRLDDEPAGPRELKMSKAAMALADIQVQPVEQKYVAKLVRMVGKVEHDETRMIDIAAWIPGRLDRLYVNYTGITVRKGHHLAWLYSPELVVAQRELLTTWHAYQQLGVERDKRLVEANLRSAEDKLRLLGLLPEQIAQIKLDDKPSDHLTIYAPASGIVIAKHANEGAYVKEGQKIYTIIDLSMVWIYLDAYESDIQWLRVGQKVEFETETYPGETFKGTIAFIDPVLDETKRTVRIRVNVPNEDLRLKPGMFVRAIVRSELGAGDRVINAALAGKWISPMHPEVIKDGPGQCDVCGMDLVRAEDLGLVEMENGSGPPLVIPATAPLITGKRAVVYVRVPTSEDLFRQVMTVWKAANPPAKKPKPTVDGLLGAIEIAGKKAERFKKWRDAVEIPALPDDKVANFDQLFAVIEKTRRDAEKLVEGNRATGNRATVEHLVEAINARFKEAGKLSDWEKPSFNGREIVLGQRAGNYYIVRSGLEVDEEVVVAGNFKIDSALQIQAKPSMMSSDALEVPDEFRRQLAAVYAPYLKLHEALADDRFEDALQSWQAMPAALAAVPSETLAEEIGQEWQKIQKRLKQGLAVGQPAGIEALRKEFEAVAVAMLELVDTFGHTQPASLYKVHCPMAFDNKGADWLQTGRIKANPYFGHYMLRCGEIKNTFAPAAAAEGEDDSGTEEPQ